jgi:acyl-CoA reductase-like NAD-dependent aldehyde dehydrogenase
VYPFHYTNQNDMAERIVTISPSTNKPVVERHGLTEQQLQQLPAAALQAYQSFRTTPLKDRQTIVGKALDLIESKQDELAKEITEQMGRPIAYSAKEVTTAVARGRYLLRISEEALKDTPGDAEEGFRRYIKKVPVGPVLVLFAWNVSTWPQETAT